MGYNLSIGEFEAIIYHEDRYASLTVERHVVDGAPLTSSGDPDDHGNSISPGYIGWLEFCTRHGLVGVFYDRRETIRTAEEEEHDALISSHPGCFALTEWHLGRFKAAAEKHGPTKNNEDYDGLRLWWLVFWTDWALKNCKYPSMANS